MEPASYSYLYRPLTPEEPLDLSVRRGVKTEAASPSPRPSPHPSPYAPAWYDVPAPTGYSVPASEPARYPPRVSTVSPYTLPYSPNPSPEYRPITPDLGPVDREVIYKGYKAFREEKLHLIPNKAGSNPNMRRAVRRSSGSDDAEYLERRARNNAAAKRSRDRRKGNEVELMLQREFLEQQNAMLAQLAMQLENPCVCDRPY